MCFCLFVGFFACCCCFWFWLFLSRTACCPANMKIPRLIWWIRIRAEEESHIHLLTRRASKWAPSVNSQGLWTAVGTGINRAVTTSGHCCLPREHFWATCAQMLPLLPDGIELGYRWEAQGLGWVSWVE